MRTFELCAVALIIEPISKITMDHRKHPLGEKRLYALPHGSCITAQAIRYAEPYHPMSSNEWNSSVILGIAVDRMDTSYTRFIRLISPGGCLG